MSVHMDNLILYIQQLANLAASKSAYVSKPLLDYISHWLTLNNNDKKAEINGLKSALEDGLDVNFIGTQWEAEWLANNRVCNCKACNVARKCVVEIDRLG